MNHEEFRLAAGADPRSVSDQMAQHLAACADCARYHAELLALDARLRAALKIRVPAEVPAPVAPPAGAQRLVRARPKVWPYGLAAAALVAAVTATMLFVSYPNKALAHAVAEHADHEPESFLTTAPAEPAQLARVLATSGLQLLAGGPMVTYAQSCPLRGHTVAHLVVHSAHGPVVVLVMTHETVRSRQAFSDGGYDGVLVPAAKGSLAVLGTDKRDLDEVVAAVEARVRYLE